MYVKAAPGSRCPMDGKPREFITDSPVEVADSAYYRRLLADGSLKVVTEDVQGSKFNVKKEPRT